MLSSILKIKGDKNSVHEFVPGAVHHWSIGSDVPELHSVHIKDYSRSKRQKKGKCPGI